MRRSILVWFSLTIAGFVALSLFLAISSINRVENNVDEQIVLSKQNSGDGIQVHGNWEVEIYDLNGDLVETRVFQNKLTTEAKPILIDFLRASWPDTFGVTKWTLHGYGFVEQGFENSPSHFGVSHKTELDTLIKDDLVTNVGILGHDTVFLSSQDIGADCGETTSTAAAGTTTLMISMTCDFTQDANIGYFASEFEYYVSTAVENFKYSKYLTYKKLDDFINVIAGQKVSVNLNISFD
tara:strand:+ start:151 stop:867 length:717 start_codon:yes stop_codon:yes gene_type:complete